MTHKEIFEALLAGKKLTYATSQLKPGERWIVLHGDNLRDQDFRLADGIIIGESYLNWQIWEEPNPHTKGTFPWALEEARRGKKVTRPSFEEGHDVTFFRASHCHQNILATDWKVVP